MGKKRVLSNEEYHSNLENSIKSEFFPTLLTNTTTNNTNHKIIPIDKLTSNYINKDKNELNLLLEQDKLNLRSSKPWLFKKGDENNSIDKDIKLIEYTKSIDKNPDPDLKLVTTSTKTSYSKRHYPFKNSKKINKPETIISNTKFKNDILNKLTKNGKQNSNKLKIEKNYDMIPPKKLTKNKNEITKRIIRNSLGLNK